MSKDLRARAGRRVGAHWPCSPITRVESPVDIPQALTLPMPLEPHYLTLYNPTFPISVNCISICSNKGPGSHNNDSSLTPPHVIICQFPSMPYADRLLFDLHLFPCCPC